MSEDTMVERLARKWSDRAEYGNALCGGLSDDQEREVCENDARWWMREIAREVDKMGEKSDNMDTHPDAALVCYHVSDRLRTEADR